MEPENLLTIQEAMILALMNAGNRRLPINDIVAFIESRNLYVPSEGVTVTEELNQVYNHFKGGETDYFKDVGAGYIDLKDCYRDFPGDLMQICNNYFDLLTVKINVVDLLWGENRKLEVTAKNIICITTEEGRKKNIYHYEPDEKGELVIRKYSTQQSLESLKKKIDPISHHLAIISKFTILNVAYFKIDEQKRIITNIEDPLKEEWNSIEFKQSKKAKLYFETFNIVQSRFAAYASLQKSALYYTQASTTFF